MNAPTFDPISRTGFEAIAYNAVGRGSEVNNFPAYGLSHSTGNSGWSVGFMQWDFGQSGRNAAAADLVSRYQASAAEGARFSDEQAASLITRLQTRGQSGNELTATERERLNGYLRSDEGRAFVQTLDAQQLERKWSRVGEPLSQIAWLEESSADDPRQSIEIVAMTSKLFNQNEVRGGRLLERLSQGPMTSEEVRDWIGGDGVRGLTPAASNAILSGRDKALSGAQLLGDAALGRSGISDMFRDEVMTRSNPSLSAGYGERAGVQLLDAAFRDPARGRQLLQQIEQGQDEFRPVRFGGTAEVATVALSESGELTITREGAKPVALDAKSLVPPPAQDRSGVDETISPAFRGPRLTTTPLGMPIDVAEQARAVQEHLISAPPLAVGPDLRDPLHPGHAAFNEWRHRVGNFELANDIPHGPHSDQLAAGLLQTAVEKRIPVYDAYLERDASSGQAFLIDRRNWLQGSQNSPRHAVDLGALSSQPIELSSQRTNDAMSKHYGEPVRAQVQTRTPEQARALAGLSVDDQVMFGRIRRDVPGHVGDAHVLQVMAAAKGQDIRDAGAIGGVMMLGDQIRVMGRGDAPMHAMVDVTQSAPKPEAAVAQIQSQNQQQLIEQQLAQQQTQQQSSGMRLS